MEEEQLKHLNPEAPEFKPSPPSINNPSSISMFYNHLPLAPPPPPPPLSYFQLQQYHPKPPPLAIYHLHHHTFRHFLSPFPPPKPFTSPKFNTGDLTSHSSPQQATRNSTHFNHNSARKPDRYTGSRRRAHRCRGNSRPIWVKKNPPTLEADPTPEIDEPAPLASYPFGDFTSLMIRNIPVRLSRRELMGMLDEHCREENKKCSANEPLSEFDLLYLPMDFRRGCNLGYAFVNFTTWEGASRLYNSWKGTGWEKFSFQSQKICQFDAAKYQGEELKKHLRRSVFECRTDEYLPAEMVPARDGSNDDVSRILPLGTRVWQREIVN